MRSRRGVGHSPRHDTPVAFGPSTSIKSRVSCLIFNSLFDLVYRHRHSSFTLAVTPFCITAVLFNIIHTVDVHLRAYYWLIFKYRTYKVINRTFYSLTTYALLCYCRVVRYNLPCFMFSVTSRFVLWISDISCDSWQDHNLHDFPTIPRASNDAVYLPWSACYNFLAVKSCTWANAAVQLQHEHDYSVFLLQQRACVL